MRSGKTIFRAWLLSGALAAAPWVVAQQQSGTPADNTRTNQEDRQGSSATADQQKENANDRALTRQIRQALVKDTSLSTYAHNVKIVSRNGQVTLRGPVRTENEKRFIGQKAEEIAGAGNVTNQLDVEPQK